MINKALRRANRSFLFFVVSALLFVAGFAGSTYAYFDGQTQQTGTYVGGFVSAPSSVTATALGNDGVLTWTAPKVITTTITTPTTTYSAATTPGVQGQRVVAHDNGTTTNCTSVTYDTTVATSLPKTQSTYTDSNRVSTTSGNGDQYCYAVQTFWSTNSWYQQATASVAQLGLALHSVAFANGNGTMATNDTITLTFNQPPASPGTVTVCQITGASGSGVILIGDSTCGGSGDSFTVGKVTGVTVTGTNKQKRTTTVSIAGNVMTIKLTQNAGTVSGSYSWTTSTSLKSAATTDQASVCTAANTNCTPTVSGKF